MAVFFTSDTHFGDRCILRSARRPFPTIAAHDAHIVAQWQETVGPDDEVWHLGDVAPGGRSGGREATTPRSDHDHGGREVRSA